MSTDLNISDNGRATEVNGLRMGEASRKPVSGTCVDDGSRRSTPRSPRPTCSRQFSHEFPGRAAVVTRIQDVTGDIKLAPKTGKAENLSYVNCDTATSGRGHED